MIGQGGPKTSFGKPRQWIARFPRWLPWLVLCGVLCTAQKARSEQPALRLRIAWGGGEEIRWRGSVSIGEGNLASPRPLGIEADEPGSMWIEGGKLQIAGRSPRAYDGLDLLVTAPLEARLTISLAPADSLQPPVALEVPLAELIARHRDADLPGGNRLLVRRAPGDSLRLRLADEHRSAVFTSGETLRLDAIPYRLPIPNGTKVQFTLQLTQDAGSEVRWSDTREMTTDDTAASRLPIEFQLPDAEGVYTFSVQARVRSRLRLWQTVAQRQMQLVVLQPQAVPIPPADPASPATLVEIDPVEAINPKWWERVTNLPLLPSWRKGPLGSGHATRWQHPRLDHPWIRLAPGDAAEPVTWEAYPLQIEQPGRPHVLEVEYPSDVPQSLGISIVEPNAAGVVSPIGVDSGVYVSAETVENDPAVLRHRLVFWPKTGSPLVLLTNRKPGQPAVFGRLRLLGGISRLPRSLGRPTTAERLVAGYYHRPLFPENFAAPQAVDTASSRALDDWTTFYRGGTRLVEYLGYAGHNGLMLSVLADGSTIYPSELLEPTPRYDTGVFFANGQDPMRKDGLDLLLRLFEREGLRLIPTLHFDAPLPELEALIRAGGPESEGLRPIGPDGKSALEHQPPTRGLAPYYNLLDPRVQQAMLRVVRELLDRYRDRPALAGLGIALSAEGYAQLPGLAWSLDDRTIAAFEREHPELKVPGTGPNRFAARAEFVSGEHRSEWTRWRAERLAVFYRQIRDELVQVRRDARLYLAGGEMFNSPSLRQQLEPTLPRHAQVDQMMLTLGIDPALDRRLKQLVLLRPQRIAPVVSLANQAVDLELNHSPELDFVARHAIEPGNLFFHPPQEARLASFDAASPFDKGLTWLVTQPSPSAAANRRRFVRALATADSRALCDGGWLLPLGQEDALRPLLALLRHLPDEPFQTLAEESQPVVVRTLSYQAKTCLYLVNDSPWPVNFAVETNLQAGQQVETFDPQLTQAAIQAGSHGTLLRFALKPYDATGVWLSQPGVIVARPRVELPPPAIADVSARLKDLQARSAALLAPNPMPETPPNQGFEAEPTDDRPIANWSDSGQPGTTAVLDQDQHHGGSQSVRLTSQGNIAWLRSDPVPVPRTGRLAVSVWLRVSDPANQPPLRLAVEGVLDGAEYYRHAVVGQESPFPLRGEWGQYVFQVPDLPPEHLEKLRVRFDLMGRGEVWIDDVQLFDLVFQKGERTELAKKNYLANRKLQDGRVADCLRYLDQYWPRFLVEFVEPAPIPESAPQRTATAPKPTGQPPADEEPGILDRLKGMLPRRFF